MAAQNQDQSMEEILQSIKRIIADESLEDEAEDTGAEMSDSEADSEVLELTEMVMEPASATGSAADITFEEPFEELPSFAALPELTSSDISKVEDRVVPKMTDAPIMAEDGLLSLQAKEASASALKSLSGSASQQRPSTAPRPAMPFRGGHTVEDLALEALRPMLKEWLDQNLPEIVERLVQREIRRLTD